MSEFYNVDNYGADRPTNWRAIAEFLATKASTMIGPDDDEREVLDRIWEAFWNGDYDNDADFPGYDLDMTSRYEGYTFEALPASLQDAAEKFWEPGYDYNRPEFWAGYEDVDPDLIYAVRKYDEKQNAPRTYGEYMAEHPEENMSWCRPYVSDDGRYAVAVNEGEIIEAITPEGHLPVGYLSPLTEDEIEKLAREIDPEYELYSGWTDTEIILNKLHETGCASCPFFGKCDAMSQEME